MKESVRIVGYQLENMIPCFARFEKRSAAHRIVVKKNFAEVVPCLDVVREFADYLPIDRFCQIGVSGTPRDERFDELLVVIREPVTESQCISGAG